MAKYITQDKIKINNLCEIFTYILKAGSTTRREIQHNTGFGWGTVSLNVNLLLEKGYIREEIAERGPGAGRNTSCLIPNGNRFVSVGLDINRTCLSAVVMGINGNLLHSFSLPFTATNGTDLLKNAETLFTMTKDFCKEKYEIFSLGIAFQGEIKTDEGISVHFPGLTEGFPLAVKKHFETLTDLPVFFGHDPDCMLLSILTQTNVRDCVLIRADEGIGMSVSQNRKLLQTDGRFELGHCSAETPEGAVSLERIAALDGIAEKCGVSKQELQENPSLYAAHFSEAGRFLGKILYNICVLFAPEQLFLTGSSFTNEAFSDAVVKQLRGYNSKAIIQPDISAACGAASESVFYRIRRQIL